MSSNATNFVAEVSEDEDVAVLELKLKLARARAAAAKQEAAAQEGAAAQEEVATKKFKTSWATVAPQPPISIGGLPAAVLQAVPPSPSPPVPVGGLKLIPVAAQLPKPAVSAVPPPPPMGWAGLKAVNVAATPLAAASAQVGGHTGEAFLDAGRQPARAPPAGACAGSEKKKAATDALGEGHHADW